MRSFFRRRPRRSPRYAFVLDTNVLVDSYSCADLFREFQHVSEAEVRAHLQSPRVGFRLRRAKDAILLADHLHRTRSRTWSLHREFLAILEGAAPPYEGGSELVSFESAYTTLFVHFVHPRVLPEWRNYLPTAPGKEASNAADRALVNKARKLGVPLISNEGLTETGGIDESRGLRKYARSRNVAVLLPREVLAAAGDEGEAVDNFFERFDQAAPSYVRAAVRNFGADGNAEKLSLVRGYLRLILKGEVASVRVA